MSRDAILRLRESTGAGLNLCRSALAACLGHEDLALRWLRARGVAVAYRDPRMHPCNQAEEEARARGPAKVGTTSTV